MYMRARASRRRLSSFHGPRPRLVSPRSGGGEGSSSSSSSSSSSDSNSQPPPLSDESRAPATRKRGVNPHERYHRNGTARVVTCSHRLPETNHSGTDLKGSIYPALRLHGPILCASFYFCIRRYLTFSHKRFSTVASHALLARKVFH